MHIEILVEEPSAESALTVILDNFFNKDIHTYKIITHQGKTDLLKQLPTKLRAYAKRISYDPLVRVFVILDRDNEDCVILKNTLDRIGLESNLRPKSFQNNDDTYNLVNRIAIEELESWFFGDPQAIISAYPRIRSTHFKPRHRNPDEIQGGTWEVLERLLQQGGYFKSGLRKIECAKTIADFMNPAINSSRSFQTLWKELSLFTL